MLRLLSVLALTIPAATAAQDLTPAQQDAVDARIRAYLLENPEIIIEALDVLEARQAEQRAESDAELIRRHAGEIFSDGVSPVLGAESGAVTLVEFFDYRCGYCKRAHPMLEAAIAANPDLRVVIKHFPVLGPDSVHAARAASAASRLDADKFPAFNDAMISFRGDLNEAAVKRLAAQAGYDLEVLSQAMNDQAVANELRDNLELGRILQVTGTPSFVIDDRILRGMPPPEMLDALIAEAREG